MMQLERKQILGYALAFLFISAHGADAQKTDKPSRDQRAIVLKDATLHTMGEKGTFVGDLIVVGGMITEVGRDLKEPVGAIVHDLEGYHVVPGLVESRGKLWLTTAAIAESHTKAGLNVIDAVDPWSEDWRELASQGITSVYVQPNSKGSLGGYGAVFRVGPHRLNDGLVLKNEVAVQASIGVTGATSKDRLAQVKALEKLIESAKEKKKKTNPEGEIESKPEAKTKSKEVGAGKKQVKKEAQQKDEKLTAKEKSDKSKSKEEEERDPLKIALRRVLKREIPLHVEVYHSDAVKLVLELAKKQKIRVVLDGVNRVANPSDELLHSNVPFVVGPLVESVFQSQVKLEWVNGDFDSSRLWSLSGFPSGGRASRWLRAQAAVAVGNGVDSEMVLAAITTNAARMLGVGELVGTLEPGRQADIAVFAGDPLDPSTPARLVLSHGLVTFESQAKAVRSISTDSIGLPDQLPSKYAIKTTRLLRDGKYVEATLVVSEGKISSAGKRAKIGKIPVYDLKNTVVTPGLVVATTQLGQASSATGVTESDSSHLRSVDVVDPQSKTAQRLLSAGFIHIGISPGLSSTSSGVAGHVRLGSDNYVAAPAIANQFVLSKSARSTTRFPASINGQLQLINRLFDGHSDRGTLYVSTDIARSIQDAKIFNIREVAQGNRKAILVAETDMELAAAIRLAKRHNLSPALLSTGRVGEVAEELAKQRFGLIVSQIREQAYDSQFQQIIAAQQAGVPLAFSGKSPEAIRVTAALLASQGLPREAIRRGLTEGGASVVGMKKTGLKRGAAADFVVWSGPLLDLSSQPLDIVVDGQPVSPK